MESIHDAEIFWVVTNGIGNNMPAFETQLAPTERWRIVQYVRELRNQQRAREKAQLGPYEWNLPPGFPFPNVPRDNPTETVYLTIGIVIAKTDHNYLLTIFYGCHIVNQVN